MEQPKVSDGRAGLLGLDPAVRGMIEAAACRLLPSTDGPGAREAGCINYIERAVASEYWAGASSQLTEGAALLEEKARASLGRGFLDLSPEEQDRVIGMIQRGLLQGKKFVHLLLELTLEGFLSDPYYGGNRGEVGWRYIGYVPRGSRPGNGGMPATEERTGPAPYVAPSRSAEDEFDVCIIGSGAGGGPLAYQLSQAGFRVIVLEKGPYYTSKDFLEDELAERRHFFVPSSKRDPHVVLHGGKEERSNFGWISQCVGGGTVHMSGFFYRLHPEDFRMRTRYGDVRGLSLADWPYSYDDLEPYYAKVEETIGVSGLAGSNPFEGPRSRPYPLPPVDVHPFAAAIDGACARMGLHPFPTPRAILSRPYRGRQACAYGNFCGAFGCGVGAKSSALSALLPEAAATGRCEIRARVMVREITLRPDGRVGGCVYLDEDGLEHAIRAKIVCVCCSAIESARLLLMSRSPRFPKGLANSNGLVGKNLQFISTTMGMAVYRYSRQRAWEAILRNGQPFLGRSLQDFYFLRDGTKGGTIQFLFPHAAPILRALRLTQGSRLDTWGALLKKRMHEYLHEARMVEFEAFHDFYPSPDTYIDLAPAVKDAWGLPAARIHLAKLEIHEKVGDALMQQALDILSATGADEVGAGILANATGHLVHGTCRAGRDPETSVLNAFCRAHEVPNLFVVDGSFMPTSGAVPNTPTIMANSFRVADHIIESAKRGELGGFASRPAALSLAGGGSDAGGAK